MDNNYCYDSEFGKICPPFNDGSVSFWIPDRSIISSCLNRLCALHGTSFNVGRGVRRSLPEPLEETQAVSERQRRTQFKLVNAVIVFCLYVLKIVTSQRLVHI